MRSVAALVLLALTLSTPSLSPAALLTPLVSGWERFFTLEWQPETRRGRPMVTGYIRNEWGMPAASVRLLVEALDQNGQVLAQRVEWLGTGLTPGTRAYFEVPAPAPAPTYRVSVFAFDWVQAGGPDDRR